MKKVYNNPTVTVLAIDVEDIITTSTMEEVDEGSGSSTSMGSLYGNG